MARRRKGNKIDGWINLDKPQGMTSTQAIGAVRRVLSPQKIGHAGTLDPLATGVLPIAMGEATKTIPFMQDALKTYSFTVTWGEARDTDDAEGEITDTSDVRPSQDEIMAKLPTYTGEIKQTPPRYSALKINGERAYDLARDGVDVKLEPRVVYIETLELLKAFRGTAEFRMDCGKGTYVRSIARDLARDLGTYGHVSALRREQVGCFTVQNAISLDKLAEMGNSAALETAVLPLETVLDDIPALALKEEETARLRNGQKLAFIAKPDFERLCRAGLGDENENEALALFDGRPVALIETKGAHIKPVKVFNI